MTDLLLNLRIFHFQPVLKSINIKNGRHRDTAFFNDEVLFIEMNPLDYLPQVNPGFGYRNCFNRKFPPSNLISTD
jgi:hypothetical protein